MPRSKRAAQFAPFAALTGFDDQVREAARQTEPRRTLSEDEAAELDWKLRDLKTRLAEAPRVTIRWFRPDGRKAGGAYLETQGRVKAIDETQHLLLLESGREIPLPDIISLDGPLFNGPGAETRPEN